MAVDPWQTSRLAVLLALALLLPASVSAPVRADPLPQAATDTARAAALAAVAGYVAALNAKDLVGALDCFSEGAGYGGGWGRGFIRNQLAQDFSANRKMAILWSHAEPARLTPDAFDVTWRWRSNQDPYQKLGVPPLEGVDVATVQDGEIVHVTGDVDPESIRARQPAIDAALRATQARAAAQAEQAARATKVANSGLLRHLPDTQARGGQSAAVIATLAAGLLLAATLFAAARPRSPRSKGSAGIRVWRRG